MLCPNILQKVSFASCCGLAMQRAGVGVRVLPLLFCRNLEGDSGVYQSSVELRNSWEEINEDEVDPIRAHSLPAPYRQVSCACVVFFLFSLGSAYGDYLRTSLFGSQREIVTCQFVMHWGVVIT